MTLRTALPPAAALDLLDRNVATTFPSLWRSHRASLLEDLGWSERAESLLVGSTIPSDWDRSALLRIGAGAAPRDSLLARARRLLPMTRATYATSLVQRAFDDLGMPEEATAAKERSRAANPNSILEERVTSLMLNDVNRAEALLDSLESLGAALGFTSGLPAAIAEVRGDTATAEKQIAALPGRRVAPTLAYLAGLTTGTGDPSRSRRLTLRAIEAAANDFDFVDQQFQRVIDADDTATAAEILARLEALDPECPTTRLDKVRLHVARGESSIVLGEIRRTLARPGFTPTLGASFVWYAHSLGEVALADSCLARAKAAAPRSPHVRYMEAWLHVQRRELAPARAALEQLVQEFPGRKEFRSLLLEAGGHAQRLPDLVAREEQRSALDDFTYDFAAVDWIQERRVAPDSARGQSAIILHSRTSYTGTQVGYYEVRERLVVQILSKEALEDFQPYRIGFSPRQGAPRIRVARVIQSDGRVSAVPPSNIVISGSPDENSDVSDALQTAIPFPDLTVGSVLDLVYDSTYESPFETGWSWRHLIAGFFPIREAIVEVRRREDFTLLQGRRMPEPVSTIDSPYVTSTWRMSDLPPLQYSPYEVDPVGEIPWVGCNSYKSWEAAARRYSDTFWRSVALSDSLREVVRTVARGARNPKETLQRLYTHLTEKVQYVAIELDRGAVIPTPANEVWRRGYGDCKDMVALLLAMLQEVGIEGQPVLVVPDPDSPIDREFVEMHRFTHVIAWVPGVDRTVFCDPANSAKLADETDPSYCGRLGLGLPRGKQPGLVEVPNPSSDRFGCDLEFDVEPLSDKVASIRVQGTYRGGFASGARASLAVADTSWVGAAIDRLLGYGLWTWARRQSWKVDRDDLETIVLSAVYRDTSWAPNDEKSVTLRLLTEIADPYLSYPAVKERKTDVLLPYAFRNRVVVRLRPGADWVPSAEIATASVRGAVYTGRSEIRTPRDPATEPVVIEQEFAVRERRIGIEEYLTFHADWERFYAAASQPYRFHKRIRAEEVARLEKYAREHPEDHGFALEAAQAVLGADVGGDGESGVERRQIAKRILIPAAQQPDAGSIPCLWLAQVEQKEGRYLAADSLYVEALRRDPTNLDCLALCATSKEEIGDREQVVDLLKQLVKTTGNDGLLLLLLSKLYALDRTEEARDYEERYFALRGDADSTKVLAAQFRGYGEGDRCERVAPLLGLLEKALPKTEFRSYELNHAMSCDEWPRAVEILEELHAEDPISAWACNNLAWAYALIGRNLERAEELARTAMILSEDPSLVENTLGAVLARQGRWQDARRIFQAICDTDDRPPTQAVNSYFVGLCDYQLGRKESAIERWQQALTVHVEPRWRRYIQDSLKLASEGGDVTGSIFMTAVAER